jgi:GNAT superfamily N-acetyltransferase
VSAVAGEGRAPALAVRDAERADLPLLLAMFGELADYEQLGDVLVADEQSLGRALFGEHPAAEALIAEVDGQAAGYAVYFPTFSTFRAKQGIWLEDLFVRPDHRRAGVGRALLAAVAARLRERGGERLEWSALTWNELALGFYRGIGAKTMDDWITHRLIGVDLERLAAGSV